MGMERLFYPWGLYVSVYPETGLIVSSGFEIIPRTLLGGAFYWDVFFHRAFGVRSKGESEAFQEIAQELVAALHVVLMSRGAKEGIDFTLGYRESRLLQGGDHIGIFHLECDTKLSEDNRIVDPVGCRLGSGAVAGSATF